MLWKSGLAGTLGRLNPTRLFVPRPSAVNRSLAQVGVVVAMIAAAGCAEEQVLPPDFDVRDVAAHTTVSCLGFPSNWYCDQIWFALEELELNENPICNQMVEVLSGAVIIWEEDLDDAYAYVPYYYVPEIHIGPLAFGGSELANTLAHEASHILGWTHPEADDVGDLCAGVI